MKEKVIKFLQFLFPYGNYRYYVMYLSSLIMLSILMVLLPLMMSIMIGGMYVTTDTFVAHSTSALPPRSDYAMGIVNKFYNLSGYILLIFTVHTGISLIVDFFVRPIISLVKWIISYYTFWYADHI